MATVGEVRQILHTRLRSSVPVDIQIRFLSQAQRITNAALRRVLVYGEITTEPHRLVYDLVNLLPNYIYVYSVRDGARDLDCMFDWRELRSVSRSWFRLIGPQLAAWAPIGRELLVLFPSLEVETTVTVVAVKLLDELTSESQDIELDDQFIPSIVDLAEVLIHARERRYQVIDTARGPIFTGPAFEALQRFQARVAEARRG